MAGTSTGVAEPTWRETLMVAREVISLYAPLGRTTQLYVALRLMTAPMIATERFFPAGGDVLDLGCGHGIFAHLLRIGSPARKVFGIDYAANRIEAANRTAPPDGRLRFEVADVKDYRAGRFQVIAVVDLLHHIDYSAQDDLLRRVRDALAPGGIIVVKDLEKRPLWKYAYHYLQDWTMYRFRPLFFRSREEMVALLEGLGLEVEVHSLARWRPYPHLVYRCRKREDS